MRTRQILYVFGCSLGVLAGCPWVENCVDGIDNDWDGAIDCEDANCALSPVCEGCGNGVIELGEECDGENLADQDCVDQGFISGDLACDDLCRLDVSGCLGPFCGDGVLAVDEDCDDGNQFNGDGCDNNCTVTACGNEITAAPEECDDGNTQSGDGCSDVCLVEFCGDGVVNNNNTEECDDGNTQSGDGCDQSCRSEIRPGETCSSAVDITSVSFPYQLVGEFAQDPSTGASCDTTPTNAVWFRYVANGSTEYVITVQNNSPTNAWSRLAIFEDSSCESLTGESACIAENAKSITTMVQMYTGLTYLILFYTDGDAYTMVDPVITIQ